VVVDFDHHSGDIAADPYPVYAQVRERCPVAWSEHYGGFWAITDYACVHAASQDGDTFNSAPGVGLPLMPYGIPNVPIDTDDPQTRQYRDILLGRYSPRNTERQRPRIEQIADELIDGFAPAGECDIVTDFAMPLPARMILRQLGFPEENWAWFVSRVHAYAHASVNDPDASMRAGLELASAVADAVAERRRDGTRDDQISDLMLGSVDGQQLTDEQVISYALLLIFGGLDTTTGALSNALIVLDRESELRNRLIEHPEDIPRAIEEFLRFDAPVQGLGRTLSRDTELAGQQLRKGERALLVWAAANRDPAMFGRPDEIDIDRPGNRHMSFGVGPHRCLGSTLGRLMFRVMLEKVLARLPDFRVVGDPAQTRYADAAYIYASHRLPITFTPQTARSTP
jgi:hypothetical protein